MVLIGHIDGLKSKCISQVLFTNSIDLDSLELIRNIRNDNREVMTNNTSYISKEEQIDWWTNLDKKNNNLYLITVMEYGSIVYNCGYGYIKYKDGKAFLTAAICDFCRGLGLGEKTFKFLINEAYKRVDDIRLEVLETNTIAYSLYKKLGFIEYNNKEGVIYMKLERNDTTV